MKKHTQNKLRTGIALFAYLFLLGFFACGQAKNPNVPNKQPKPAIAVAPSVTAAEQTNKYLAYLKGKRLGMVVNPTSVIGLKKEPLVDYLAGQGYMIKRIFGPEHGFRGDASAGVEVANSVDKKTGIPVISLYGKKQKPGKEDLEDLDLMIFDMQDVGARFYTYIYTLFRVMEACAENGKELMILDRPNPNAYVDGPVLNIKFKSGVGLLPLPITHGLTVAELAQMINGEKWLAGGVQCKLRIVPVANYTHQTPYILPVNPSPNLNTAQSILLYPSLCLFEGTVISQGRGTNFPFTVLGNPVLEGKYPYVFTPKSIPGMSETPLHQDQKCYGLDLRKYDAKEFALKGKINLQWLIELYNAYPDKPRFFDYKQSKQMGNFDKLAGTDLLRLQIIGGKTEEEIRKSWEPDLDKFREMRKKYLLYP